MHRLAHVLKPVCAQLRVIAAYQAPADEGRSAEASASISEEVSWHDGPVAAYVAPAIEGARVAA